MVVADASCHVDVQYWTIIEEAIEGAENAGDCAAVDDLHVALDRLWPNRKRNDSRACGSGVWIGWGARPLMESVDRVREPN